MAYCSNADVVAYIGDVGADSSLIDDLITRAQQMIDTLTNRTFEAAANTTRNFDSARDVEGPVLFLDADLAAVDSITNGDGATVTTAQYVTEPRNAEPFYAIRLLASSGLAWEPDANGDTEDAIAVSGKWARSESAPTDIAQACIEIAAWLYKHKDSVDAGAVAFSPSGVLLAPASFPRYAREVLALYRRR